MRQAEDATAAHGASSKRQAAGGKGNPAVMVEKDVRAELLATLRQLNLDIEPRTRRTRRRGLTPHKVFALMTGLVLYPAKGTTATVTRRRSRPTYRSTKLPPPLVPPRDPPGRLWAARVSDG